MSEYEQKWKLILLGPFAIIFSGICGFGNAAKQTWGNILDHWHKDF